MKTLKAIAAIAALISATALWAQTPAAFSIDGESYPRTLFDLKVQARMASAGRNIQSLRHPGALRNYQQEVLNRLIEEQLLAREARRSGISISEAAIDAAISAAPAMPGMSTQDIRDETTNRLLIGGWVQRLSANIKVDTGDIIRAMAADTRPVLAERAKARHILLRLQNSADPEWIGSQALRAHQLLARLKDGATFADLAREHSADSSAANGGALGWFGPGQMVAEFEQAAFSAPVGQPVGPVRTVFGWHLILVEARDPARPATDEEWQQRLRSRLAAEELALQIQKFIYNSRKNTKIIIYLGG